MTAQRKNKILYCILAAFRVTALLCASGTLIQTFLSYIGFSTDHIYIHTTVLQAATVLTILLFSHFADKRNVLFRTAIINIPSAVLYLLCIPFCMVSDASVTAYILLILIGALQAVITGFNTICEYKLPYIVFTAESYGTVLAVSGISSALLSLGVGALISYLTTIFSYSVIMLFAFLLSSLLMFASFALYLLMKPLTEEPEKKSEVPRISLLTLLRYPIFLHLLPANLLRGFAAGVVSVLPAIALSIGLDEGTTALMVSVDAIAHLLGCAAFAFAIKFIPPRFAVGIASLFFCLLPFLMTDNAFIFLLLFGVFTFARYIVNYAVPASLRFSVSAEMAGPYNAWRMILHNGGVLLATTVAVFIPVNILLILSVIAQFFSGASFVFLKIMKTSPAQEIKEKG